MQDIQNIQRENLLFDILSENIQGLSITDLVNSSNLPRSKIRILLAKLEGAGKISFRNVGMAKLYYLSYITANRSLSSEYKKIDEKMEARFR